jgi:hypothetical protein
MSDAIIYQDRPDVWRHTPNSTGGEIRNLATPIVIAFTGKLLVVMNHGNETRISIPVSRWRLLEIGLNCIFAAFKR